jgi:hypothetical protein
LFFDACDFSEISHSIYGQSLTNGVSPTGRARKAFCLHSGIIPPDYDFGDDHVTTWNYQQTHFVTSAPDIRHFLLIPVLKWHLLAAPMREIQRPEYADQSEEAWRVPQKHLAVPS